jgi:hypothetical protein
MAKVIGFDPKAYRKCTCYDCYAIIEYSVTEEGYKYAYEGAAPSTDEGCKILGITCPNCSSFVRTNW